MEFTKEQLSLSELICKHTEKENRLQDLMEIMLEILPTFPFWNSI